MKLFLINFITYPLELNVLHGQVENKSFFVYLKKLNIEIIFFLLFAGHFKVVLIFK